MTDAFTGEIRMFVGDFAPRTWSKADGQIVSVTEHAALYSLYGTIYGGNGVSSFALPDLRGRIPLHHGQGPGLTYRPQGQMAGQEHVTLSGTQIPSHTHSFQASKNPANTKSPIGMVVADVGDGNLFYKLPKPPTRDLDTVAIKNAGGGASHSNTMPFLCLTFIVCMLGVYPPRNK